MILPSMPLLRFALHLLLGLAVLLQSGMAVAMHHGAATGAAAAPASGTTDVKLPPCHALPAAPDAPATGCCDDSALGQLCQWACAQAVNLAESMRLAHRPQGAVSHPLVRLRASVPWSTSTPLRPPIA